MLPDQQRYDFKVLADEYVTTREDFRNLGIAEGAEVFFTGLFQPHVGEQRNYPVVRFGRVAMVTNERIAWEGGLKSELYLIEATSSSGNSGSPVFFYLGAEREPGKIIVGPPVLKLAGVVQGFFGERRPIEMVETAQVPVSVSNLGIAAVIPAHKLHEILFGDELRKEKGLLTEGRSCCDDWVHSTRRACSGRWTWSR